MLWEKNYYKHSLVSVFSISCINNTNAYINTFWQDCKVNVQFVYLGRTVRKRVFGHMWTVEARSACTSTQSDKGLHWQLTESLDRNVLQNV